MERAKGEDMKYFSAFSGVGGFDLGMPANWECIGMSEINKQANMVLKYHFKDVKNYGDIEKINYEELPDFELLIGGSPCQDISIAGKRAGLAGLRSRLFFSYVAILKSKKPQYFIFENVKGLLSSNSGWDFAEVANQFSEAGYDIWWQVLDARDYGIPQHRERIFIFGTIRGEPQPKVFLVKRKTGMDTQEIKIASNGKWQSSMVYDSSGISPTLQRPGHGENKIKIAVPVLTPNRVEKRQNGRQYKEDGNCAFTITRQDRNGIYDGERLRYLTPLECERLMGWPDNWTKYGLNEKDDVVELSDNARYNLIGNGVVPQVVRVIIGGKFKDL
jgi:DNA (cytosine-5)-methyltransferase 1